MSYVAKDSHLTFDSPAPTLGGFGDCSHITAPGHVVLRLKLRDSCGSTTTLTIELLHP